MRFTNTMLPRIKAYEGFRAEPYKCPAKKWTIGYGYNFEARGLPWRMALDLWQQGQVLEKTAEAQLIRDCQAIDEELQALLGMVTYTHLPHDCYVALHDATYQMGISRFRGFKRTIALLKTDQLLEAADELLDSEYGRAAISRARAADNAELIRQGARGRSNVRT